MLHLLHHEGGDVAMKDGSIVFACRCKCKKIEGSARAGITKDLALEISLCCMNCNRHSILEYKYTKSIRSDTISSREIYLHSLYF